MAAPFVILTGASGVGKTSIALAIEQAHPEIQVFRADTIGVPSPEVMASYGEGHHPGGAWQRAMTLEWIARIAPRLAADKPVLFEGQMRLAFLHEALSREKIDHARILLVECGDAVRDARLTHHRLQPELANESMAGWSRYLHQEAVEAGFEILDTTACPLDSSIAHVLSYLKVT